MSKPQSSENYYRQYQIHHGHHQTFALAVYFCDPKNPKADESTAQSRSRPHRKSRFRSGEKRKPDKKQSACASDRQRPEALDARHHECHQPAKNIDQAIESDDDTVKHAISVPVKSACPKDTKRDILFKK